jgi:hypothetical protein
MSDAVDNFLEHHGVPGMKWGKHKNKADFKAEKKSIKKAIYKQTGQNLWGKGSHQKGKTVAAAIFGTPGISAKVGYDLSKAAGYSKGKSLAIGLLGGAPGGIIAANISAGKMARGN